MKKLLKFLSPGLVLALFNNASCNEPDLPIPTGDHTFSCRINGKLFLPQAIGGWSTSPSSSHDGLSYYVKPDYFNIQTGNNEYNMFYINIINWKVGTFNLIDSNGYVGPQNGDPRDINHVIVIKNGVKYLSKQGSGSVIFTVVTDTDSKGTFEFDVYNENNNSDVLHITNGQFDD
jgi:hypothetical protein